MFSLIWHFGHDHRQGNSANQLIFFSVFLQFMAAALCSPRINGPLNFLFASSIGNGLGNVGLRTINARLGFHYMYLMPVQVKDAEREVSVQGRKIQELEARLAESESTVARLRTELSRVEAGREGSEKAEPCRSPQQEEVQKEGLPETNGPPPVLMRCQNNIKKVEAEEPLQGGGGERTLKYTFRRKRKRGLPATSPDKLENPAGAAPSRDSRRIVQVARQVSPSTTSALGSSLTFCSHFLSAAHFPVGEEMVDRLASCRERRLLVCIISPFLFLLYKC